MKDQLDVKLGALRSTIRRLGSALVAYSGGVDSALVMAVAHQELGGRMVACIADSPSLPRRELHGALQLAERMGVPIRIVSTNELADASYAANPDNRCYYCKRQIFAQLQAIAAAEGWNAVLDGANASDLGDYRPGRLAAAEWGVGSPLAELGIGKQEVRELARRLGLPVWDKPAMACLASRVPPNTPITLDLLHQIEAAEDVLEDLGFGQFRVRHHGDIARVELPIDDLPLALQQREAIVAGLQAAGYRFVTLDLAGYHSGSLSPGYTPSQVMPIPLLDAAQP